MYPENKDMEFDCPCPIRQRKNVWNDITGVHVRFCPMCNERREQYYEPKMEWADTGRGSEPMPAYLRRDMKNADEWRGAMRGAGKEVPKAR